MKKYIEAIELYKTGNYSLTKLGILFSIDRGKLSTYLKNQGITVENKQNKCSINEHIFDNIDTEEKAYWLGFLYADGYISYNSNHFELSLQLNDLSHLEKFKNFLSWTKKIATDTYRCRCCLANKHLHKTLNDLGCTPRKSLTLQFPTENQVPRELIRHFMRGYFDGDGCIRFINKNYKLNLPYTIFEVLGTKEFLDKFNELLPISTISRKKDKRHLNNTVQLNFCGEKAIKNFDFLYENSTIYLERKYNKYLIGKNAFLEWKHLKEMEQNRRNPPVIGITSR